MDEEEKKILDINTKFYESARAELIQRIILRDSALVLYIAGVGTYMNHVIDIQYKGKLEDVDLAQAIVAMIPLPIVCVVFALIILQHHIAIGQIGGFLRNEINWSSVTNSISRHWDNSLTLKNNAPLSAKQRLSAQALVLTLPLIYNFVFFYRFRGVARKDGMYIPLLFVFTTDIAVTFLIFWLHIHAHRSRGSQWKASQNQRQQDLGQSSVSGRSLAVQIPFAIFCVLVLPPALFFLTLTLLGCFTPAASP